MRASLVLMTLLVSVVCLALGASRISHGESAFGARTMSPLEAAHATGGQVVPCLEGQPILSNTVCDQDPGATCVGPEPCTGNCRTPCTSVLTLAITIGSLTMQDGNVKDQGCGVHGSRTMFYNCPTDCGTCTSGTYLYWAACHGMVDSIWFGCGD